MPVNRLSELRAAAALLVTILLLAAWAASVILSQLQTRSHPAGNAGSHSVSVDGMARLVAWPGKQERPCPPQDARTAVLLVLGQSNAANHGGGRLASRHAAQVLNYSAGRCFEAGSPLLGATGQGGEPWTRVGDYLIERGLADTVVIVAHAVSGSAIARWRDGGDLNRELQVVLDNLRAHFIPTQVLFTQGESDFARGTTEADYAAGLDNLASSLRAAGVTAPLHVAVATRCVDTPSWSPLNPVSAAQRAAPHRVPGIAGGPDLDRLLDINDRYDGCHLTPAGLEKVADAWASLLTAGRNGLAATRP